MVYITSRYAERDEREEEEGHRRTIPKSLADGKDTAPKKPLYGLKNDILIDSTDSAVFNLHDKRNPSLVPLSAVRIARLLRLLI